MKLLSLCYVVAFVFGCATDADPVKSEPAESTVESELVCQQYFCVAGKVGSDCEGFGVGSTPGSCQAAALSDCTANCGPICRVKSTTCDS
jgi:hypothetical protein